MTIFTVPRGQARALFASLLPHAGRQSEDTPDYGRVRFAPDPDELVAWTIDGATAAAGYIDITHHDDHEADLFDLSTGALKAALAVFRGPSDKDARQMWADQDLRITVDADSVTLEEVEDILDGRSLTVERWVTQGEDRYPDVPRTLSVRATAPDLAEASVSADALARFIPSAKAWDAQLLLTITGEPRRLEVRIGARLIGLCPARRRDDDDVRDRIRWDEGWDTRLTRHVRVERPAGVDQAVVDAARALNAAGATIELRPSMVVDMTNGRKISPAPGRTDAELLEQAAELVITTQFGSPSMLQRKLHVSFGRAAGILTALEHAGVVAAQDGHKAREVLMRPEGLDDALTTIRALADQPTGPASDALTDDPDGDDDA